MKSLDVLFTTDRFNLSIVKAHFVNDCCFGEDVAAWVRGPLTERGYSVIEPGQEDWGWYVEVKSGDQSYVLSIGGNSNDDPANPNLGEWRIGVEKSAGCFEKTLSRKTIHYLP